MSAGGGCQQQCCQLQMHALQSHLRVCWRRPRRRLLRALAAGGRSVLLLLHLLLWRRRRGCWSCGW